MNITSEAIKKALRENIKINREKILKEFDYKCCVCGLKIKELLEIHHMVPLKNGGSNELYNLKTLCPTCHKMLHIAFENNNWEDLIPEFLQHRTNKEVVAIARLSNEMFKLKLANLEKAKSFYEERLKDRGVI